jgi:hypothetical protein
MEYYKKINLKCEKLIRDYLLELVIPPNKILDQTKISHELPKDLLEVVNAELASYGISEILYCQSYLRSAGTTQGIHIDGINFRWHAAINLPVQNTQGSKFIWYSGSYNVEQRTRYTGSGNGSRAPITFFEIVDQELTEAASIELNQACLIRVDEPHNAVANDTSDRWIFTMRFVGNPTFEELYEKLPS